VEKYGGNLPAKKVRKAPAKRVVRKATPGKGAGSAAGAALARPKADTGDILANTVTTFAKTPAERKQGLKVLHQRKAQEQAVKIAPVLSVLEQTTRPLHAIAGAADAAITGKRSVGSGFTRGMHNRDHTTFSTVLKHAGAPKAVQSVAGFALDVAADPTTYLSFGTSSVTRKAALDAGNAAAARAAKAGMSKAGQETVAKQAAKQAAAAAKPGQGLTIKLGGHAAPGVTSGTAAVARTVRKIPTPSKVKAAGGGAKNLVRDVRPTIAPAGIPKQEFLRVHDAAASARGGIAHATARAQAHAQGLQKHVPDPVEQGAVIHAIETKTIGQLPEHLRKPAIAVRSELRYARRKAVRSGLAVHNVERSTTPGAAKGYFPHALADALHAGDGAVEPVTVEGVGRRAPSTGSMKHRTDQRPVQTINAEEPGKFSTDLPLIAANHLAGIGTATERAHFNRVLASAGRPIAHGESPAKTEAVYVVKGANIHEVKPGEGMVKGGRYVALDRKLAESSLASVSAIKEATATGHLFNKGNRLFKRVATFTPGFHVRNAIGDTQMAYLSQPGHRLPVNTVKSLKVIRAARAQDKAVRKLEAPKASGKTIKIAGQRVPVEQAVTAMRRNAATQTGYIGRELDDLVGRKADGQVKKVRRGSGSVTRLMQDRENLMRGATYLHQVDTGAAPHIAGRVSRDTHIDYGDLTPFERQARRVLPFYTFTARATPLHIKKLLTNPGKFANYQKLREEAAAAFGLQPGYENDESTYQKQQAGIPLKIGGKAVSVSLGLPVTTLNWIPAGSPAQVMANTTDYLAGMVTPFIKSPVEYKTGKSFFTHNDIQSKDAPLVSAPGWVKQVYEHDKKLAKVLGIVPDYVDSSGKKTWGWYGRADYVMKQFPGPFNVVKQLTTPGTNRAGQGTTGKTVAALTGIKPSPIDPIPVKKGDLYQQRDAIKQELGALSQRGIKGDNANQRRTDLNKKMRDIQTQIYELSLKHGDKLPSSGAPTGGGSGWGAPSSKKSGWGAPSKSKSGWG
jgi:hypothetical protein